MRKTNYTILALACMSAVFACARIEEPDVETAPAKVRMTFAATIDAGETKTVLEGSLDDEVMHTWWMPSDEIGIVPAGGSNAVVEKFVNMNEENSDNGSFEGNISMSNRYYAVYPSGSTYRTGDMNMFLIDLPQTQPYVEGSFAQDIAPMVASAGYGEILHFKNLCGLLALRLKGEESIRSISFSGKGADGNLKYVSGMHYVPMTETGSDYTLLPATGFTADGFKTYNHVTLVCDEPVALSADEATPFYFVIPPGTYETFTVMITTADGKVMMKEGKTPLTIEKAHVKPTAALEYAETVTIDLSSKGTANSYIVSEPGLYSFDADVMGNGEFGIIQGAGFHTEKPYITPASAELLWEDKAGIIGGISYADNKISFVHTGTEGNALIAAKDEEGTILWSWHIWATDMPETQTYVNSTGTYEMLDRNLGATTTDSSVESSFEHAGTFYQWGRKDPFIIKDNQLAIGSTFNTIAESINNPTIYASGDNFWANVTNTKLWEHSKTIYDPCPVGYQVAMETAWNNISIQSSSNYGVTLGFSETDSFYYPYTPRTNNSGSIEGALNDGDTELWTTNPNYTTLIHDWGYYENYRAASDCYPVRCMKQSDFVTVSLSIGRAEDITTTSAHIEGHLAVTDKSIIIEERGFVHGTTAGVTIETGTQTETGNSTGSFSADLTSLTPLTRYYVRAYAVMTDGSTYYSNAVSFVTPGDDGVTDLSVGGTANSYMVYPVHGIYTFDLVKGNSTASVGNVTTVEVLWETLNTTDAVSVGDVIESAELSGTKAKFTVPEDAVPGNALIVAKNSGGRILWSWHIWVVDLDPDATGQIYPSGAMLMDRNLGALVNDVNDVRSFGLFYQWGRKDPFVGYGGPDNAFAVMTGTKNYVESGSDTNTLSYSILHPNTVIHFSDWNSSDNYWDIYKTIYDPCPAGWRVADNDAWIDFNNTYEYPKAGMTWGDNALGDVNYNYYIWSSNIQDNVYYFHRNNIESTWSAYGEMNVRCMKDADFILTTGSAANITDVSAVVSGTLEVRDNTVIEVKGLVCSSTDGSPKLHTDNVIITEKDGTAGTFTSMLTGLKPNTTYYVRAYAIGGYNTRYGEVISFKTISGGSGEGFDDGGDYEWE